MGLSMQMKMRTRDSKRKALSIQHSVLSKAKAPRIAQIIAEGRCVDVSAVTAFSAIPDDTNVEFY